MNEKVKKKNYSIGTIALLIIVGSIFVALGIAILEIAIDGIIRYGIAGIGVGILMPIVLILALLGFGITAIVMGSKQIYLWVSQNKTIKYGRDATAKIIDYTSASHSRRVNNCIRYSFTLSYNDNGETKAFKTDYLYDINEFRYLKELDKVKIKINGKFVVINECFTKEIYKLDSTYGIEKEFFKQKPVAILLRLWPLCFFISMFLLFVSLGIGNSTFATIAIILVFTIHFPFVIPLAIYLIKWFRRKK